MEVFGREIRIEGKLIRIGFIDGEGYQFLEEPEAALRSLQESGTRIDLFTFIQKLSDTSPKYSYPQEWDNMAVLPITTYENWMTKQIDFKVRNKIRKATKNGILVREIPFDEFLVQGIYAVYNESPVRQGKRFRHYGKDLESVRRMTATFLDRAIFIGAFLKDELVGFIKLVYNEDRTQAGLMNIIAMIRHRDKAPTNALVAQAVRSCAERGIPYLWYANMSYGKKQRDTLADFKRHNGFQRVQLPRYYVPMSRMGRIALTLGLHHSIADWIPEPLIATYRRIRMLWYARKFPGLAGALLSLSPLDNLSLVFPYSDLAG